MIGFTTPAKAGFSEETISKFLKALRRREINFHSIIMLKGNDIFFEKYRAPFTKDTPHRMYSVTKSFVSLAIGFLMEEGRLNLDDEIVNYFPDKQPEDIHPYMRRQTIRNMLMMSTCLTGVNWFRPGVTDRTAYYFSHQPSHPAGTLFQYDSTGSYVLGALVERLTGMKLLDYLKEKLLNTLGGFENAHILEVPDGGSWGDSALLCTSRALMNCARFVMNGGVWEGKRLLSEEYLRLATTPQINNAIAGAPGVVLHGYGYQFWCTEQDGFAFNGMGGQFAICVPKKDFIFVCNGDTQYNDAMSCDAIFRAVFDILIPDEEDAPEETNAIPVAHGEAHSDFEKKISGKTFVCNENPMGITSFGFEFSNGGGIFRYENAQGPKALAFGLKNNVFGKFPQLGYSDERGNVHEITDFMYDCAASAGWLQENMLQLRVQIIDRYFGNLTATFGFLNENTAGVRMIKNGEDFLNEYDGWMGAEAK
ncbi:MAG: serine hydrolase [Clostridia bacterium]|nr:serine hydrolase [Clostridia bacterium]